LHSFWLSLGSVNEQERLNPCATDDATIEQPTPVAKNMHTLFRIRAPTKT